MVCRMKKYPVFPVAEKIHFHS